MFPWKKDSVWMYSVKMKGIPPPSCQIHHMGTNHWITSVQDTEEEQVILFDSSQGFSLHLSRSLEMQLFAIYGRGKRHLQVVHPRVQQQHSGVDCGIFATAYATEFVFNQYTGHELTEFDRSDLCLLWGIICWCAFRTEIWFRFRNWKGKWNWKIGHSCWNLQP